MKKTYFLKNPCFTVKNIDILNVSRRNGFKTDFRSGRLRHGFIFTVFGQMSYTFATKNHRAKQWEQS